MNTARPSISIIVPNFNGGATLEAALLSLIDQKYPSLEILVVDGGSTDNSLEIIRKHEQHITWWVSEKDSGQSHALNKGFAQVKGEIVNWLCSDDALLPGSLDRVATTFEHDPATDVVAGASVFTYPDSRKNRLEIPSTKRLEVMPCSNGIAQPACFFRRSLLKRNPVLDESLHYTMDFELWNYFRTQGAVWKFIPDVISSTGFSDTNKTSTGGIKITYELEEIYKRYVNERIPLTFWHRRLRYPLERIRNRHRGRAFGSLIYYPYQCSIILLLSPFYGYQRVRWMNWADFV